MIGAIIIFLIAAGLFVGLLYFCFYNGYKTSKEKKELKEKYDPIYTAQLKHTSGLPVTAGAIVKVIYCEDRFIFLKDKQEITVSRDKIKSVDCVTGKNLKTEQATGAAAGALVFGGLSGAVLGSLIATSTYLVINYESKDEPKSIILDTFASGLFAVKVSKDFKKNDDSPEEKIEL